MSSKMVGWAFDQRGLSATEKIILLALADWANDDGECWPGQLSIAAKTDLSESTVRRGLHRLADKGLVTWEERRRPDGYKTSNTYHLNTSPVSLTAEILDTSPVKNDDLTGQLDAPHRSTVTGQEPSVEPSVEPESAYALSAREDHPGAFSQFWTIYPRKVGKRDAQAAFERALKRTSIPAILIAAQQYADNPHVPEKHYIPHPATWLNRDGWNDELPGPRTNGKATPTDRAMASMSSMLGGRSEQRAVGQ